MIPEQISRIAEKLTNTGVCSDVLDEVIHETFSGMASDINNSGIENQVEFLLGQGYTEEQILKL